MSFEGYYSFPSLAAIAAAAAAAVLWFLFSKRETQATQNEANVTHNNSTDASTSASASSVSAGGVYEVFLSFHGKDTRDGFTDFLYTYLVGASIQTFRDDNELRVGKEIGPELLKAIKESKISIPIFSQNYAYSKWCLLELQQIVDCHENGGQMIYPIFYDVDPSDVCNQRGSYEKAFIQHEKNYSEETVQKWRDALRMVGELKGLELEKETNGRQGELVKRVVEKVLLGLKKNYTHLPENLVGMDNHTNELMRLLDVDSNQVHIVGIHGMGGLGKTTIAKVIYNELCERFESQCFLYDVREKSKHGDNGIVDLQKQLFSNILNRKDDQSFSEVNEGRRRISDAFRGKKFLLVLDDVDEISQVKMLIGDLNGYGAQSRIILTTRDKEVLDAVELTCEKENQNVICRSYEPDLMGEHDALELFSKYAFMRDTPKEGYQIHSKDVVKIAAGLPLVLMVLGSAFFLMKDQDLWEKKIDQLRKIPHHEVLKKLRVSFDALTDHEKEIFLDIACFFIGKDVTMASYMWEDSGFFPEFGIRVLTSKSLIKVGDNNELIMHDHLRDLGRQIVFEEGKKKPWKRSRLWDTKDVLQTLKTNQDTSSVNAISVNGISVVASDFENLPNLRYLSMFYVDNVDGDFKHLLPNLRWFRCREYPFPQSNGFFPINLNMKNLVVLDLSYCVSRDDWDGWNKLKMINNLKYLDLLHCMGIPTLLDLSNLTKLVELILSFCDNLFVIQGLDKLESLERLEASYCSKLNQIEGVQKLTSLEYLNLDGCWKLKGLGDLSNLKKLQVLKGAPGLDTTDFSNMKKLKQLDIINNNRRIIDIQNLYGLKALEELKFDYCPSVVKLPNLSSLKRLKKLTISHCSKLIEIQGIAGLELLNFLIISSCESLERLTDLPNFGMLKHIRVSYCHMLQKVEGLEAIESLEILDFTFCKSLQKLPDLSACQKLKDICVFQCVKLSEILGLGKLISLEKLSISGCSSIEALLDLSACQKLKYIDVSYCEKLSKILGLEKLISLEKLSIPGCSSIEALPDLSACQKIKEIDFSGCEKLSKILGLEELKSLTYLDVRGCKRLGHLPNLAKVDIELGPPLWEWMNQMTQRIQMSSNKSKNVC